MTLDADDLQGKGYVIRNDDPARDVTVTVTSEQIASALADGYTPTTVQRETDIRNVYALHFGGGDLDRGYQNFDAWLSAHDREVAERAWDEGFTRGFYSAQSMPSDADASESSVDNPYREGSR